MKTSSVIPAKLVLDLIGERESSKGKEVIQMKSLPLFAGIAVFIIGFSLSNSVLVGVLVGGAAFWLTSRIK